MQRGHRAGEQKACAALAQQHMRLHDLHRVNHAVVGLIVGIHHVAVRAVAEQPALGGHGRRVAGAVVHSKACDQLLAGSSAGFVVHRAGVFLQTGLLQHHGFDFGRHGRQGRASRRNAPCEHVPADTGVAVVRARARALDKAQAVRLGFTGLVVNQSVPACVGQGAEDLVLLLQRQLAPGGAGRRRNDSAPGEGGGVVVGASATALDKTVFDGASRVQVNLAVHRAVTQGLEHHRALRHGELLEGDRGLRCGHAAPVHGAQVKSATSFGKARHPGLRQRRCGLEEMQTAEAFIAQRARHHVLLLCTQAGKSGASRRLGRAAPFNELVAVVGDHALREVRHQFATGRGPVVEVLGGGKARGFGLGLATSQGRGLVLGLQHRDGIEDHGLLAGRQVLELHLQRRAQLGGHQQLLVVAQLSGRVALHCQTGIAEGQRKASFTFHLADAQLGQRGGALHGGAGAGRDQWALAGRGRADGLGQGNDQAVARDVRRLAQVGRADHMADGLAVDREAECLAHRKAALQLHLLAADLQARIAAAQHDGAYLGAALHTQEGTFGHGAGDGVGRFDQLGRLSVDGLGQAQGHSVAGGLRVTGDHVCASHQVADGAAVDREAERVARSKAAGQGELLGTGDGLHLQARVHGAQGQGGAGRFRLQREPLMLRGAGADGGHRRRSGGQGGGDGGRQLGGQVSAGVVGVGGHIGAQHHIAHGRVVDLETEGLTGREGTAQGQGLGAGARDTQSGLRTHIDTDRSALVLGVQAHLGAGGHARHAGAGAQQRRSGGLHGDVDGVGQLGRQLGRRGCWLGRGWSAHVVGQHGVLHRQSVDGERQDLTGHKSASHSQDLGVGGGAREHQTRIRTAHAENAAGFGAEHIDHVGAAGGHKGLGGHRHGRADGAGQRGGQFEPGSFVACADVKALHGVLHRDAVDLEADHPVEGKAAAQAEHLLAGAATDRQAGLVAQGQSHGAAWGGRREGDACAVGYAGCNDAAGRKSPCGRGQGLVGGGRQPAGQRAQGGVGRQAHIRCQHGVLHGNAVDAETQQVACGKAAGEGEHARCGRARHLHTGVRSVYVDCTAAELGGQREGGAGRHHLAHGVEDRGRQAGVDGAGQGHGQLGVGGLCAVAQVGSGHGVLHLLAVDAQAQYIARSEIAAQAQDGTGGAARDREAGFAARVQGDGGGRAQGAERDAGAGRHGLAGGAESDRRLLRIDHVGHGLGHIVQRGGGVGAYVTALHGVAQCAAIEHQRQGLAGGEAATEGEQVGLRGHKLDVLVDHGFLRTGQARIRRAGGGLGHRAPLLVGDHQRKVQARGLGPLGPGDRAVVKGNAGPVLVGDAVVVKQVTQAVGHHQLLRGTELGKAGVGSRWRQACGSPVNAAVVIVRRLPLGKARDHLLALGQAVVKHGAAVHAVAQRAGNDLLLRGAEGGKCRAFGGLGRAAPVDGVDVVAHHRAVLDGGEKPPAGGVEVAPRGHGLVALGGGNRVARGLGQLGKRHVVGQGHQHGFAGVNGQRPPREQSCELAVGTEALVGIEAGHDGRGIGLAGSLGQLQAVQVVEVVGKLVFDFAGLQRHLARRRQGAGQGHFARGAQGQGGFGAGEHGDVDSVELVTCGHRGVGRTRNFGRKSNARARGRGDQGCTHRRLGVDGCRQARGHAGQGVCALRLDVARLDGVAHSHAIDGGSHHLTGGKRPQQREFGVKARARYHRAAAQQVDVAAAREDDAAAVVAGGHGATLEQGQARACAHLHRGARAAIDTGKHPGGAVDGVRGGEQDPAVGGQRLEGAAFVGSEAVDLGAVGDKAPHTGAASHPDVDQLVGNHPARHQHLLVDVDVQLRRLQAGIWRTQRRTLVLPLHHQRARIEREQLAGLHVTHNFHAVGHKGGEIVQAGGEDKVIAQGPVFEVANAHDAAGRAVAYVDLTETIGQRRHVARAQFQVARIHPCGIVVTQAGLPCPADAVVLRVVHAADQQRA